MKTAHKVSGAAATGAVVAVLVNFTPTWEGMDKVARPDPIAARHPITYCYGQTDEFGKVKAGQRFTKQDCDPLLVKSMTEIYIPGVDACLHAPVPVKSMASFVDGSYNAGVERMCASAIIQRANAGDIAGACNAFDGWIVTANHQPYPGLIARRAGEKHGDKRKSERALCLEGLKEPKSQWYSHVEPAKRAPWWAKILNFLKGLKLWHG